MIDHDRLFKELLSTFFLEFLELFVPAVAHTINPESITFLQQEYFADLVEGEEKVIDLLVEVQHAGREATFLVHVEAQASTQANFNRRMFHYFARLHQRHLKDIYPIVVFSFDQPYRAERNAYKVEVADFKVLEFRFQSIQLNQLNWRDFIDQRNPVAAALMAKMQIAKKDRPKVKAECLRLLVTLKLNPAKTRLITQFVDTYLRLDDNEEQTFQSEIDKMSDIQKEEIVQITTSWEETGIEKGQRSLVLRQLTRKVGALPEHILDRITTLSLAQLESLGEALLDFTAIADLSAWLDHQG
jgi:predicted transposase/invertase (TIGR01784 family)